MRKRALVVDTQMGVRTLVSTVLERDGFDVVLTCHPDEALAAGFAQFDLLVTAIDLEEPLDGVDLARTLRALHPEIQIMYLTQRDFLVPSDLSDDRVVVLKEPFTIDQLRGAVRAACGGRQQTRHGA